MCLVFIWSLSNYIVLNFEVAFMNWVIPFSIIYNIETRLQFPISITKIAMRVYMIEAETLSETVIWSKIVSTIEPSPTAALAKQPWQQKKTQYKDNIQLTWGQTIWWVTILQ